MSSFNSIACLAPNEKVWVEACREGDTLTACRQSDDPILLTVGGSAVRAHYVLAHTHGSIALALLGALMLFVIAATGFRHHRTVVESLARTRGVTGSGAGIAMIAIGPIGAFISLCTWATTYGPWFLCGFVALTAFGLILTTVGRMQVLGAARHVITSTQTAHLNSEQGLDRELAVRVAHDAPPIESFRGGERHAIVRFEITESYTEKSGSKTVTRTRRVGKGIYPKLVPIVDASGRGMLALDHCEIDVPDEKPLEFAANLPEHPSWLAGVVGTLDRSKTHKHYTVTWGAVQPGEPLLVYGGIERVRPSAVGQPDNAGYREAFDVPLVRGQAHAPVLAYVGTEAALASGTRTERTALAIGLVFGALATTAAAAAFAWVLQL